MPTVIAHRGASAAHPPGNIEAAFRAAGPLGATWVELDVRRTADDNLVVHHDAVLPDGRALVDLTLEDLPGWLPSLDQALDACAPLGVNIEIKNDPGDVDFDPRETLARDVVRMIGSRATDQPLLISSFRLETVDRVRELDPSLDTAWLRIHADLADLEIAALHGHGAIHPGYRGVDRAYVDAAHGLGLAVNVWTVDEPRTIRALIEAGVDGVVTNVPDVARRVSDEPLQ